MRVLVAEDDRGLRDVLARGLREKGYVVDPVADGQAAIEFLCSYDYAVVILDWRMPERSGLEVLQWMRRRESPTAVLIGYALPGDRADRRARDWRGPRRTGQ